MQSTSAAARLESADPLRLFRQIVPRFQKWPMPSQSKNGRAGILTMCIPVFCLALWCGARVVAAPNDYYVSTKGSNSKGNGSMAHPWATIAYAAQHIGPGATVHVAAGVYQGSFTTSASGTPLAHIIYVADSARFDHPVECAQVTADHGSLSSCVQLQGTNGSVWENRGDYVTIQGFDLSGPNIGIGAGALYTSGEATEIIANSVHDVETSSCGTDGNAGISPNGNDGIVDGNYVYDIGPAAGCQFTQGIYPNGDSSGTTLIENNIVFKISSFGIQSWGNSGGDIVVNNTVFNTGDGCIVLGTDTKGRVNQNDYIANNICYGTRRGIMESGYGSSATGKDNVYKNNLFYRVGTNYILQNGLKGTGTVDAAPLFVHYTGDQTGDYHLQANSPAVCAGAQAKSPAFDFDGASRERSHCWGIGAYG